MQNVQAAADRTPSVIHPSAVALPSTPNVTIVDGSATHATLAAVNNAGITFGASFENGAPTPAIPAVAATDLTCDSNSMPVFGDSPVSAPPPSLSQRVQQVQPPIVHKSFDSQPTTTAVNVPMGWLWVMPMLSVNSARACVLT